MTILQMFEKVNIKMPLSQRKFLNFLNDTQDELQSLYEEKYLTELETGILPIESIEDTIAIDPLYHFAMVDNILFLSGAGDTYKSEFARKSSDVNLRMWHKNTIDKDGKAKKLRRARW